MAVKKRVKNKQLNPKKDGVVLSKLQDVVGSVEQLLPPDRAMLMLTSLYVLIFTSFVYNEMWSKGHLGLREVVEGW